jgi:hypothetical protein
MIWWSGIPVMPPRGRPRREMARDPKSPEWFDRPETAATVSGAVLGQSERNVSESDIVMVDDPKHARRHGAIGGGEDLDDRAHAELLAIYNDAAANLRFAKAQQWRTLIYFTAMCALVVSISVVLRWGDATLVAFMLYTIWFFSVGAAGVLVMLQSWHGAEHARLDFCQSHFTEIGQAAMRRKPKRSGDVHRYILLALMLVYVELVTISVTRMMWPRL